MKRPANDNYPTKARRIVNAIAEDTPITEFELILVETYLGGIIETMLKAANDNQSDDDRKGK